jgi:hypothetical protein
MLTNLYSFQKSLASFEKSESRLCLGREAPDYRQKTQSAAVNALTDNVADAKIAVAVRPRSIKDPASTIALALTVYQCHDAN